MSAGGGKALRHGEKVLTTSGWKNIEEIKVGDAVLSPKNTIELVTGVFPQGLVDIYRVTFQDGRHIDCCGNHLWKYHIAGGHGKRKVSTTLQLKRIVDTENTKDKGVRRHKPVIPLTEPLTLPVSSNLPIKPYTMGALLGDGSFRTTCVSITAIEQEIIENIRADGYETVYWGSSNYAHHVKGVIEQIRELGLYRLYSYDKFIPEQYITASIQDRWAIVQGLMDTDGYVDSDGATYFDTVSPFLCEGIKQILLSLGFSVTVTTKVGKYRDRDGGVVECQVVYKLYIRGKDQNKLFRLKRKVERTKVKNVGLRIDSIEKIGQDLATCISITGDRLFITTNYVVTHNTFAGLMYHLKHVHDPLYRGLTIRRTTPMLMKPGAVWDEAKALYKKVDPNCQIKIKDLKVIFSSGAEVGFSHFERADNTDSYQGSQNSCVVFDELTHFEESQFLYLLSRLRTKANMKPVARATMNPDPDSWVRKWVDWYLFPKDHPDFGRPDPSKQGVVRWFVRDNNEMIWGSSKEELLALYPKATPLSFKMIFAGAYDNPYIEPSYIAFLEGLPRIEKEILLHGNWEARASAAGYFKREWTEVIPLPPLTSAKRVRSWDISGTLPSDTNPSPDYTAGVLMSKDKNSIYYVEDVVRDRRRYAGVLELILETARRDGVDTIITVPVDPGAAAKAYAADLVRQIVEAGYIAKTRPTNKSKVQRFAPFAALAEAGGVRVVRGDWNDAYFLELERFDGGRKGHDD